MLQSQVIPAEETTTTALPSRPKNHRTRRELIQYEWSQMRKHKNSGFLQLSPWNRHGDEKKELVLDAHTQIIRT